MLYLLGVSRDLSKCLLEFIMSDLLCVWLTDVLFYCVQIVVGLLFIIIVFSKGLQDVSIPTVMLFSCTLCLFWNVALVWKQQSKLMKEAGSKRFYEGFHRKWVMQWIRKGCVTYCAICSYREINWVNFNILSHQATIRRYHSIKCSILSLFIKNILVFDNSLLCRMT